jgi:hypothetical protein
MSDPTYDPSVGRWRGARGRFLSNDEVLERLDPELKRRFDRVRGLKGWPRIRSIKVDYFPVVWVSTGEPR